MVSTIDWSKKQVNSTKNDQIRCFQNFRICDFGILPVSSGFPQKLVTQS